MPGDSVSQGGKGDKQMEGGESDFSQNDVMPGDSISQGGKFEGGESDFSQNESTSSF
jgi:hypothetical protein